MTIFQATVERNGSGWNVQVDGLPGPSVFHARNLADIEPRALKLIWGCTGVDHDRVDIDIRMRLPEVIQDRLEIIRQQCDDIDVDYDTVIAEMTEMGISLLDISCILALYHRPPRPLAVTNAQMAAHGLDGHPDVVGVEWADHGFALTRTCRRHIVANRRSYRDADPEGLNALVYPGIPFRCDFCHEGDDLDH